MILICGNKIDLLNGKDNCGDTYGEALTLAMTYSALDSIILTSAKDGSNVDCLFDAVREMIVMYAENNSKLKDDNYFVKPQPLLKVDQKMAVQKLKICVLGKYAVGKTSLIRRYIHDKYDDQAVSVRIYSRRLRLLTKPNFYSSFFFRQLV